MRLADIAPRLARARDQFLEEQAKLERERRHLADERLRRRGVLLLTANLSSSAPAHTARVTGST